MINDNDLQTLQSAQPAWRIPGKSILGDGVEVAHQFATIEVAPIVPSVVQQDTPAAQQQIPSAQGAGNDGPPASLQNIIIAFNGTLYYNTLVGTTTGPV